MQLPWVNNAYKVEADKRKKFDIRLAKARGNHQQKQDRLNKAVVQLAANISNKLRDKKLKADQKRLADQKMHLSQELRNIRKAESSEQQRRNRVDAEVKKALSQVKTLGQTLGQIQKNFALGGQDRKKKIAQFEGFFEKTKYAEEDRVTKAKKAIKKAKDALNQKMALNAKKLKALVNLDAKDKKHKADIKKAQKSEKKKQEEFDKFYGKKLKEIRKLRKSAGTVIAMNHKKNLTKNQAQNVEKLKAQMDNAYRNEMTRRANTEANIKKVKISHDSQLFQRENQIRNRKFKKSLGQLKVETQADVIKAREMKRRIQAELDLLKYDKAPRIRQMLVADYIIEGAIVGYDTNEKTEGLGARFIAIGGDKKYRQDIVTVALRLVHVNTGEILAATSSTKTIYSIALQGGTYKFIALNRLLEIEAGITRNEPPTLAVRQALEHCVMDIIQKGLERKYWSLKRQRTYTKYR